MSLTKWHGFGESIRWRLTPDGVEIEGAGIERTRGAPITATRLWETWGEGIDRAAKRWRVPNALIIATIATESGGKADAVRLEPGYASDEKTPHRISAGLMQTLLSTASETLSLCMDRTWLLQGENSIYAGTAYIARQARSTNLDPALVAAAYNAGGVYENNGAQNRWKMRQYPMGTSAHCDRFVKWFNDAAAVLKIHSRRPAVGIEVLLGSDGPALPTPPTPRSSRRQVQISFGSSTNPDDMTPYSRKVLEDILRAAEIESVAISSTARDPENQARVMYDNLERYGVEHQKKLYARAGQRIIDQYVSSVAAGKPPGEVKTDMARLIREIGPTNVSRHASDPKALCVFDVAPSSVKNHRAFEMAVKADSRVALFLTPPQDPGYHLEIPQPRA